MTNKKGRTVHMLIGNHFGKRKPEWNFFIKSYESFKYGWSLRLMKILTISMLTQVILLSPVIYWIYQNYAVIEKLLPVQYNLQENIQFEKKWIVFLVFGAAIAQGLFNFFLWKSFLKKNTENITYLPSVTSASLDEVDYQRRAS